MIRGLNGSLDKHIQNLVVSEESLNCAVVEYKIPQRLSASTDSEDDEISRDLDKKVRLLRIDYQNDIVCIHPKRMNPEKRYVYEKYENIKDITLIGWKFNKSKDGVLSSLPRTSNEVIKFLKRLPSGFIRDYEYGLGFLNRYRCIIDSLEKIPYIQHLVISSISETGIDESIYTLNINDFRDMIRKINRIYRSHQDACREERRVISHNCLMPPIDPWEHPKLLPPAKKDAVSKLISETNFASLPLSKLDSKAVVNLVSTNIKNIYKNQEKDFLKLGEDIELLNLEGLIRKMKVLLLKDESSEAEWQKIINDNPFIISIVFGYPVFKIKDQASVGGRKYSGAGDKITDFLVKNDLTDNTALIEIKTPGTPLLNLRPYRGGVHAPSSELSGSINQLLDQKYVFQKEITFLRGSNPKNYMESYSVECILIIGKIPNEEEKKKSFELFRHNSRDVKIFTFDELLRKLEDIYSFLKEEDDHHDINFDDIPF